MATRSVIAPAAPTAECVHARCYRRAGRPPAGRRPRWRLRLVRAGCTAGAAAPAPRCGAGERRPAQQHEPDHGGGQVGHDEDDGSTTWDAPPSACRAAKAALVMASATPNAGQALSVVAGQVARAAHAEGEPPMAAVLATAVSGGASRLAGCDPARAASIRQNSGQVSQRAGDADGAEPDRLAQQRAQQRTARREPAARRWR